LINDPAGRDHAAGNEQEQQEKGGDDDGKLTRPAA
jgi:hypothetical protein